MPMGTGKGQSMKTLWGVSELDRKEENQCRAVGNSLFFFFLVIFCHCRLFWGLTAEQAGLGGQHVKMCFALLMRHWHQASNGDRRRNECLKSSAV